MSFISCEEHAIKVAKESSHVPPTPCSSKNGRFACSRKKLLGKIAPCSLVMFIFPKHFKVDISVTFGGRRFGRRRCLFEFFFQ